MLTSFLLQIIGGRSPTVDRDSFAGGTPPLFVGALSRAVRTIARRVLVLGSQAAALAIVFKIAIICLGTITGSPMVTDSTSCSTPCHLSGLRLGIGGDRQMASLLVATLATFFVVVLKSGTGNRSVIIPWVARSGCSSPRGIILDNGLPSVFVTCYQPMAESSILDGLMKAPLVSRFLQHSQVVVVEA